MLAGAKTHQGEDAQSKPAARHSLFFFMYHTHWRGQRGHSTTWQRHMHRMRKTRGDGEGGTEEGREGQAQSEERR